MSRSNRRPQSHPSRRAPHAVLTVLVGAVSLPAACGDRDLFPRTESTVAHTATTTTTLATPAQRTWYLSVDSTEATVVLPSGPASGDGALTVASSAVANVIDWAIEPAGDGVLEFREILDGEVLWFRGNVTQGVINGRWAVGNSNGRPPVTDYKGHFTGWNRAVFERSITPRVFDMTVDGSSYVTVRIDASPENKGRFVGTVKQYATKEKHAVAEQFQYDIDVSAWDGSVLAFDWVEGTTKKSFRGRVDGKTLAGASTEAGTSHVASWSGVRSQVLTFGMAPKADGPRGRDAWQTQARAQLKALLMAGAPTPISTKVELVGGPVAPIVQTTNVTDRDDDPLNHPADYQLQEFNVQVEYPNPYGGPPMTRALHGRYTIPKGPPPAGGFVGVIALNGHNGSSHAIFDPSDKAHWYGDAFARRGMVVLSIDVGHRPVEDRAALYTDVPDDDSAHGNGPHPAIKAEGFDSDWEENGERAADAMTGVDLLLSLPSVDPHRIVMGGVSMGGEVSTFTAALDTRIAAVIDAAFEPDMSVFYYTVNHLCWLWLHGNIREYIDTSDLFAMIAPRVLLMENGKADPVYSYMHPPFEQQKQEYLRASAAFADAPGNFIHYLHYDAHVFHLGDVDPYGSAEPNLRVPVASAPTHPEPETWQSDPTTYVFAPNVFSFLGAALR